MKDRVRWNGNCEAQRQADEAWNKLRASAAAKAAAKRAADKPQKKQPPRKMTYHEYIASKKWLRKRRMAFAHYGHKCTICGASDSLNVHHRHYRTLYRERVEDLDVLCSGCHANRHEGKRGVVADPVTKRYLALRF